MVMRPHMRGAIQAAMVLAVLLTAFAAGRWTAPSQHTVLALGVEDVEEIRARIDQEEQKLEQTRTMTRSGQLEMARELGRMQASLDRLNALGETLAEMAMLDPELFDFSTEPPLGGPLPTDEVMGELTPHFEAIAGQLESRRRQLDILEHLLLVSQMQSQRSPSGWPVLKGWISSRFGARHDPFTGRKTSHHGLDFAAPEGSDVVAVAAGIVSYSGRRSGYGWVIEVNHGNGYTTRYAHNKKNLVTVGDRVDKGQRIGLVGKSGRSTGPHVHFEVILDGRRVDPAEFVARAPNP